MSGHLNKWAKFWLVSGGSIAVLLSLNPPVLSETKIVNVSIKTEKNQSFANLMQQAESIATESIEREFQRLSTVREVGVTISGERNGQEVPLLSTKVSRLNWQAQPRIQFWTNYFTKAATLLGFNQLPKVEPTAPNSSVNLSSNIENDPGFRDD